MLNDSHDQIAKSRQLHPLMCGICALTIGVAFCTVAGFTSHSPGETIVMVHEEDVVARDSTIIETDATFSPRRAEIDVAAPTKAEDSECEDLRRQVAALAARLRSSEEARSNEIRANEARELRLREKIAETIEHMDKEPAFSQFSSSRGRSKMHSLLNEVFPPDDAIDLTETFYELTAFEAFAGLWIDGDPPRIDRTHLSDQLSSKFCDWQARLTLDGSWPNLASDIIVERFGRETFTKLVEVSTPPKIGGEDFEDHPRSLKEWYRQNPLYVWKRFLD